MWPLLAYAKFLIWIVVPLSFWGATEFFGLPHIRWSYTWIDEGQGYDPFARRHYTRCTFWGPNGSITIHPTGGNCGSVQFFKAEGRS